MRSRALPASHRPTIHLTPSSRRPTVGAVLAFLFALVFAGGVVAQPAAPGAPAPLARGPLPQGACDDGVVKDDGTVETGWGWVSSVVEGIYVQQFSTAEIAQRGIDEVCVCFLRTREDPNIDFEVVFYRDAGGFPEEEPFAAFPARLEGVPQGIVGAFAEVPTPGVRLPAGTFYVGARWDASVDQFFFVCADTSEETEPVPVWFRDDRATGWANTLTTSDPIFAVHRAILVRPVGTERQVVDVPATDPGGLLFLAALLVGAGLLVSRRGG